MDYTKTDWVAHETKVTAAAMNNIENAVEFLTIAVPAPPSVDGTYTLQVTISSGEATYAWV